MEAVSREISKYALTDAQSDNANNISLKAYYRMVTGTAVNHDQFMVMDLSWRPNKKSTVKSWQRKVRLVSDFTDEGKRCLVRLQEQIKTRFPKMIPGQAVAMLLDPMTKRHSLSVLGEECYSQAKNHLIEQHRVAYEVCNEGKGSKAAKANNSSDDKDESMDDEEDGDSESGDEDEDVVPFDVKANCTPAPAISVEEKDRNLKADQIVTDWLEHQVNYNDFLYDGQKPIPKKTLEDVGLFMLTQRFDTMRFFSDKEVARMYPTIKLLARVNYGKFSNSGFQERVFSTAGNAMGSNQTRMDFVHLEKRTLIAHNKQHIRDKVI
jgi:hypothetical protein